MAFPIIHQQSGGVSPSELMVFGERNSGTNLVDALLQRNVPALAGSPGDRIGRFGFRYGWKHGFPQMLAAPDACLAVAVFRHPEPWVRSMHARPWHAVPALRDMVFEAFIRAEWQSRVDERNFGVDDGDARAMAELHWDRHPLTGARFTNIAQLRRTKTQGFLSLKARFANCLFVRHEDVVDQPQVLVEHVAAHFGLHTEPEFQPIEDRRGKAGDGTYTPSDYAPLDPAERDWLWSQLDPAQEEALGYAPLSSAAGQSRS
ncbi:MAG: hypothetical protein AB8B82_03010 [Roseovarius sp.]